MVYLTTCLFRLSLDKLPTIPRVIPRFILGKWYEQKIEDENTCRILRCCAWSSHCDDYTTTSLPLSVLPILVEKFDADKCWMMDALNLLIDFHFRSIVSDKNLLNQLEVLKAKVDETKRVREGQARVSGMVKAMATAVKRPQ